MINTIGSRHIDETYSHGETNSTHYILSPFLLFYFSFSLAFVKLAKCKAPPPATSSSDTASGFANYAAAYSTGLQPRSTSDKGWGDTIVGYRGGMVLFRGGMKGWGDQTFTVEIVGGGWGGVPLFSARRKKIFTF
jgi:hypothetical protein